VTDQPPFDPAPGYGYGQPPVPSYGPGYGDVAPNFAHWGLRVGSFLVDQIIASLPYLLFVIVGFSISAEGETVASVLLLIGAVASVAVWVWNLVRQGRTGQTLGKSVVGTVLLSERTGQPVGAGTSIGRSILHFVDGLPCYLGYLWPIWDARKQTFSDKIMGTVVIRR
jgi:uncharacterized RDD family membrane protein YckC